MSLSLLQGYSSAEEEEKERFSDEDFSEDDDEIAPNRSASENPFSHLPKSSSNSLLPSAIDVFSEIAGPPEFLNNAVVEQASPADMDRRGRHGGRKGRRDAKDLPADAPVLSASQERKLQGVRDHPEKDLGVLLPKESGGVSGGSGPSQAPPAKRKAVDRGMIGALLSSRSTPPSKAARVDSTIRGDSSPVSIRASSLASTPSVGARLCSHRAASLTALPSPATSSAPTSSTSVAIRESSSLAALSAPTSCPLCPGAPAGVGPMLGNPLVIRERLARFVFPPEVSRITSLGTERVIDTFLEGLAQASTASVCLLSKARHNSQLKRENESMRKELSIAQKKIADFEADRGASEAARERVSRLETELSSANERAARAEGELLTAHERESRFETALSLARERARRAEAELVEACERASLREVELVEARERASLREAELVEAHERASLREAELVQARERASFREAVVATEMKAAHDRASQAEKELAEGVANAFIDGYEELRGKITAAFPGLDFSGFLPTEEPDDTEDGEEDEEDDEDDEGSYESS